MHFCIRDDDTSFFTKPDDLERAYSDVTRHGPVSLAVIPFARAGTSPWVPEALRCRWSVHALGENKALVEYLRKEAASGHFEIMIHGYNHEVPDGRPEFSSGSRPGNRIGDGRKYLEDLLGSRIRVFVPPHNAIGKAGLRSLMRERLNLGGTAGLRSGWSLLSPTAWRIWYHLRRWRIGGGVGIPWILDLGDHCELAGAPVTPLACLAHNEAAFEAARSIGGVFCAATHHWELKAPSRQVGESRVGEHLQSLIKRAVSDTNVHWKTVGDVLEQGIRIAAIPLRKPGSQIRSEI